MIYFKLEMIEDSYYKVILVHHKPFDPRFGLKKSREELLKDGVFYENMPKQPDFVEGYVNELRATLDTKELYYETIFKGFE